jgi:hypothetical protein
MMLDTQKQGYSLFGGNFEAKKRTGAGYKHQNIWVNNGMSWETHQRGAMIMLDTQKQGYSLFWTILGAKKGTGAGQLMPQSQKLTN